MRGPALWNLTLELLKSIAWELGSHLKVCSEALPGAHGLHIASRCRQHPASCSWGSELLHLSCHRLELLPGALGALIARKELWSSPQASCSA